MGKPMNIVLGGEVMCDDGVCGELRRVVVDPATQTLTHLVIEPSHQGGAVRLVPADRLDPDRPGIRLQCSVSEYKEAETASRVPVGMVAVSRTEQVHAADGDIGRARGLVIDSGDRRVTHLLLDVGLLWRRKRYAIPVGAVSHADDGLRVNLSKGEIRAELPVAGRSADRGSHR
jgi:sporulation protein YlmC with PRC-barrel domain